MFKAFQPDNPGRVMRESLILLGTFLPFIGIGATALLAVATRGPTRWMILTGLPAVTLGVCWFVMGPVWSNGNLLAAAIYMTYVGLLLTYYPVLVVVGAIRYRQVTRHTRSA
jgi:hypothetical protein